MIPTKDVPKETRPFIQDVKRNAKRYNVKVIMSPERSIDLSDGTLCNGYFEDGETPTLAVACGQSFDRWLAIFVHESCHMDQWREDIPEWTSHKIGEIEAMDLVLLWIDHKIELNEDQLINYIKSTQDVELDCEKRSVEKIRQYNLPININEYIQKANAYVMFYAMLKYTRKWYSIGNEPYHNEAIWKQMPMNWLDDYDNLPIEYHRLFLEHAQ